MSYKIFRFFASLMLALAITFAGYSPALAAPPVNDNFANAEVISSLPFSTSVDITESTIEPGEPNNCGFLQRTVWYSFTPSETLSVRADTQGGAITGSANIYRTTGTGIFNLQFLGCVYSDINSDSSFTFLAEAGQTYYLQAGVPLFGGSGTIQVNLQQVFPPANDFFANAEAVTSLPFSATPDITDTGSEIGEPQNCYSMQRTVWYSFTSTETMSVRADMLGSAIYGYVNIYHATGSGISNLQPLTCVGPSGGSSTFLAEAGQTYYLQAGVSLFGGNGTIQVNLQQVFPPANDFFANAEAVASLPFSASPDITDTTVEPNEPQNCNFSQRTVWYSFTSAETMSVRVDTLGGAVNSIVEIYHATGTGISNLQYLTCVYSGSPSTFLAEAGQTYYLQASPNGGIGTIQINLQQVFPPANDNFANAEVITSLPFTATVDITDTGIEPNEPQNCIFSQRTVWYSFTPAQTMSVRVDTLGGAISSIVEIYHATGTGISKLQYLTCVDSGSSSTFLAEAGQTYYLQAKPNGEMGTIQINLQQVFPPANDIFANAEVITSLPFTTTVDITDTGIELNEPQFCNFSQRTVWYSFTPTQTMNVRGDTLGGATSSIVGIYHATGSGISNLQYLTCVYSESSSVFLVEAGQTYYLQASPYGGIGTIQINLQQAFPPANDNFENAEVISSLPFSASPDMTDAGIEPNEPQFCNTTRRTVWYSFTPAQTMSVRADTQGGAINGLVHIYHATGSGISNLQFLQCVTSYWGSSTFLAEAGQTYYLQASPYNVGSDNVGTIQINLEQLPSPTMEVDIDIKPGNARNRIEIEPDDIAYPNDDDGKKISVAILSTEQFNALEQVDRNSLTFGSSGDENSLNLKGRKHIPDCRKKDVNKDRLPDLVCKFNINATGFQLGDTVGILKGLTVDGLPIEGHDSVVIKVDD